MIVWLFNTLKYKITNILETKMIRCNLQDTLSLSVAEVIFSSPQNCLQLLERMLTSPFYNHWVRYYARSYAGL